MLQINNCRIEWNKSIDFQLRLEDNAALTWVKGFTIRSRVVRLIALRTFLFHLCWWDFRHRRNAKSFGTAFPCSSSRTLVSLQGSWTLLWSYQFWAISPGSSLACFLCVRCSCQFCQFFIVFYQLFGDSLSCNKYSFLLLVLTFMTSSLYITKFYECTECQ